MTLPSLFSLIFYMTFIMYPLIGIYVLSLNPKDALNRVFFLLCISLSTWSLSFSLGNSASTYESALFWRRFGAFGWGTAYSILVHFFLVMSGQGNLMRKHWLKLVIYLPAVINIAFFSILTPFSKSQYSLAFTSAGWINQPSNRFGDWFFNVYYISFSLAAIVILFRWNRQTKNKNNHKTALLIAFSVLLAIMAGTLTDILNTKPYDFPDIGIVLALLPFTALLYSIKKHGVMMPAEKSSISSSGEILSEQKRFELFRYVAIAFIVAVTVNLSHFIFFQADLSSVLMFSTYLFIVAAAILLLPLLPIRSKTQDAMLMLLLAVSIPLIMLNFLDGLASNMAWPIPFLFMALGAIYSKKRMIIILFVTAVLTQLWSWYQVPRIVIEVIYIDHILRLFFYTVGAVLTIYLNQTYVQRLRENEKQVRFQNMLSGLSSGMIQVGANNIDDKINEMP